MARGAAAERAFKEGDHAAAIALWDAATAGLYPAATFQKKQRLNMIGNLLSRLGLDPIVTSQCSSANVAPRATRLPL